MLSTYPKNHSCSTYIYAFYKAYCSIPPPLLLALFRDIKGMFKKDRTFAIKNLLLILQHFKHCPLQSSPLYWWYTVPNVSSIVGMLPGTHFLWWRAVLLSHFAESPLCFGNDVLSKWFQVWETWKSLLGHAWLSNWNVSVKFLPSLQQNFTHTHTLFFKLFHCHFVTNLTNSLCTAIVAQRLMLIAKRDKWQFVVKTWR